VICTAAELKAEAARLPTPEQREAVIRAWIVAGLLPLPAERRSINFGSDRGPRFMWDGKTSTPVTTKPNDFVSKAPRLPALVETGILEIGLDDLGTWYAEVITTAGTCRTGATP
jgi:hypothetical protein